MVGYESYWVLPFVMKSGGFEEIEIHPIFEVEFGETEAFLEFDEVDRNITTDADLLTRDYVGLHILNFTVIDTYGEEATYRWEMMVMVPNWPNFEDELYEETDDTLEHLHM